MPFCPKCCYEYRWGVSICPDCQTALVEVLPESETEIPEDKEFNEKDWVALARLTSRGYSDMVVERLRESGIPAMVFSQAGYFGTTDQMSYSAARPGGGGFIIMVHRDFVAEANTQAELLLGEEWTKCKLHTDR